jgi:hypothetical protein
MKTAKVENKEHLVRDLESKAVLNTNVSALKAHLKQRDQLNKVDLLENKINNMESKIDLILRLLTESDK